MPQLYREVTRRTAWRDLRALLIWVLVMLVGLLLADWGRSLTTVADDEVRQLFTGTSHTILEILLVVFEATALVLLVAVPIGLAIARRWHLLLRALSAGLAGAAVFWLLERFWLDAHPGRHLTPAVDSLDHIVPSAILIAAAAAAVASLQRVAPTVWLISLWVLVVLVALARTLTDPDAPLDVPLAIGVGGVIGTAVLLAFGRRVSELTAAGVSAVLADISLPVRDVVELGKAGGSWEFSATAAGGEVVAAAPPAGAVPVLPEDALLTPVGAPEGTELLVRTLDQHEWRADALGRAWRRLRLRDAAGEFGFASPSRAVMAEAMMMMLARNRGVRMPWVRAVSTARQGEALLAVDKLDATPLNELDPSELTPELLTEMWRQVALLQRVRIAHHEMTLHHFMRDGEGRVWLIDLAEGEVGAAEGPLTADLTDLLASSYVAVGAERAVGPALAVLGPDRVTAAAQRLVPAALDSRTRGELKKQKLHLDPLADEIAKQAGVERPPLVQVERFKPRTLVVALCLMVAFFVLLPEFAEWPTMIKEVKSADWTWVVVLVLASAATYLGSGLGLTGGTPARVPVLGASSVALAGTFVGTFSPPGVSTVGLNVRYLQCRGLPLPVAVSASAAKEGAVGVMHVITAVVFVLWAGTTGEVKSMLHKLPPLHVILIVVVGVLAVVAAAFAIPTVRRAIVHRLLPALKQAGETMKPLLSSPLKLLALFGGVAAIPLGYGVALWASMRAFDHSASFVTVVLVSLTAGALASAVPTPGGIGAVEAVLMAALTAVGFASSTALAGVLLYRIGTFWIALPTGLVAFKMLTARKAL